MYRNHFKRLIDFVLSATGFVVLLPVFAILTITLFIANGGKPFFVQPRPGKNGKIFNTIKFRSMNNKKDALGNLLSDGERLTKAGKFIRKTSLDELPQLINVVKGEMSLVGPRPLRIEYLPFYNTEQSKRHNVRPGITGWAQVNGRNTLSWEEKFRLDVFYVENIKFSLDCKILLLTVKQVLRRENIYQNNDSVNTKPFSGINLNR